MNQRCGRYDPCLLLSVASILLGILSGVLFGFGLLPLFFKMLPFAFAIVLFGVGIFLALFLFSNQKSNGEEGGGFRWRALLCLSRYWESLLAGAILSLFFIFAALIIGVLGFIASIVFVIFISAALWLFGLSLISAIICFFRSTCSPCM